MLSLRELLMAQKRNIERYFRKNQKKRKILSFKNQVLRKSTPVSSHDSINANYRQVSLTGTDHSISKLSKVFQFEKKTFIGIFWNVFRSWTIIVSHSPTVKIWTISRFFYILKYFGYCNYNYKHVYSVTRCFIWSVINFLSIASFSCDRFLQK